MLSYSVMKIVDEVIMVNLNSPLKANFMSSFVKIITDEAAVLTL